MLSSTANVLIKYNLSVKPASTSTCLLLSVAFFLNISYLEMLLRRDSGGKG